MTMPAAEKELRHKIVVAARHWVNTPVKHRAKLFQVGVDCAHVISAVYGDELKLLKPFDWPDYQEQWWRHTKDELLITGLQQAGFREIDEKDVEAGDIVISRVVAGAKSGCFGHAAIITSRTNPMHIIHANPYLGRVSDTTILHPNFDNVPKRWWTIIEPAGVTTGGPPGTLYGNPITDDIVVEPVPPPPPPSTPIVEKKPKSKFRLLRKPKADK